MEGFHKTRHHIVSDSNSHLALIFVCFQPPEKASPGSKLRSTRNVHHCWRRPTFSLAVEFTQVFTLLHYLKQALLSLWNDRPTLSNTCRGIDCCNHFVACWVLWAHSSIRLDCLVWGAMRCPCGKGTASTALFSPFSEEGSAWLMALPLHVLIHCFNVHVRRKSSQGFGGGLNLGIGFRKIALWQVNDPEWVQGQN